MLAERETEPKSDNRRSTRPNAAYPPFSSNEERRNSLAQTSPQTGSSALVFSTPIRTPFISPRLGLPITEYS